MCGSESSDHRLLGRRLNQSQGKNPTKKKGISTTVMKCTECGLIFSNPQPVPVDIQDHYGIVPEAYWKDFYFKIEDSYFKWQIDRLKTLTQIKPGFKALDVGAGLGKAMIALKRAGMEVYGLEPSIHFHERAISKMGIDPDKLKLGMIEEVEYPENEFDFINFGAVLEHLYDPSRCILKAMKWLKPNGLVHIEVPSSEWLVNKLVNTYYKITGKDYVANLSPMHQPFHLHEFSYKSFMEHGKRNNYEIAHHEYYVCKTYLPKLADFFIVPYMKWTNTGMQLCVWLRKKENQK